MLVSEDGRRHVPLKRRLTFNGLHGVLPQKIIAHKTWILLMRDMSVFVLTAVSIWCNTDAL
jgi:hypothetical protein